jgi:hypothetical protein
MLYKDIDDELLKRIVSFCYRTINQKQVFPNFVEEIIVGKYGLRRKMLQNNSLIETDNLFFFQRYLLILPPRLLLQGTELGLSRLHCCAVAISMFA